MAADQQPVDQTPVDQQPVVQTYRCPDCDGKLVYDQRVWQCDDCDHVPRHPAD